MPGAQDRWIRLAASHPHWALGVEAEPPLGLVEAVVAREDPAPKALASWHHSPQVAERIKRPNRQGKSFSSVRPLRWRIVCCCGVGL